MEMCKELSEAVEEKSIGVDKDGEFYTITLSKQAQSYNDEDEYVCLTLKFCPFCGSDLTPRKADYKTQLSTLLLMLIRKQDQITHINEKGTAFKCATSKHILERNQIMDEIEKLFAKVSPPHLVCNDQADFREK